mmetsp:Transcript_36163/g.102941  ORF Transcript_36163/g.102941 Transcript_36163/m.102941 type:complete len:251 (+) Transcript_36163:994-1746(+)
MGGRGAVLRGPSDWGGHGSGGRGRGRVEGDARDAAEQLLVDAEQDGEVEAHSATPPRRCEAIRARDPHMLEGGVQEGKRAILHHALLPRHAVGRHHAHDRLGRRARGAAYRTPSGGELEGEAASRRSLETAARLSPDPAAVARGPRGAQDEQEAAERGPGLVGLLAAMAVAAGRRPQAAARERQQGENSKENPARHVTSIRCPRAGGHALVPGSRSAHAGAAARWSNPALRLGAGGPACGMARNGGVVVR